MTILMYSLVHFYKKNTFGFEFEVIAPHHTPSVPRDTCLPACARACCSGSYWTLEIPL